MTVQQQNTKIRVSGEFGYPYGIAPEYKFGLPGGMGPPPEPNHFWRRTQRRRKFVEIRVGG
jgi:hypothetical protein